jgi:hypothetical protein
MRLAVPFLLWLAAAGAAAAQPATCEASATGKAGEVIALVEKGKTLPTLVTWVVERREGVGEESDHFSRPGLMVDFTTGPALTVSGALVNVTRISRGGALPLSLSQVRVRARAGGDVEEWPADDTSGGEARLMKRLKANWPAELRIDLVLDGEIAASSTFDLSVLPAVETMARQAADEAVRKCAG